MKVWANIKAWIQPLLPAIVVLLVSFWRPGWSPAGLFSRLFATPLDEKQLATINGAIYTALLTYVSMGVLVVVEGFIRLWQQAEITVQAITRWDKQCRVRIAPGSPVAVEIATEVTYQSEAAYATLRRLFPDLAVEASWNNTWLEVVGDGLQTARIRDEGPISRLRLRLFDALGPKGGEVCPGLLIDVRHDETRRGSLDVRLTTRRRFLFGLIFGVGQLVAHQLRSLEVRIDSE